MSSFLSFFKKTKYGEIDQSTRFNQYNNKENEEKELPSIPDGLWVKCKKCGETIYTMDLSENLFVCKNCNYHFRISSRDRLETIADNGSFIEFDKNMHSVNPLNYPDYEEKLSQSEQKTNEKEAVITGQVTINGQKAIIAIMDFNFMGGSLGSVVGEKLTRAIEKSIEYRIPIIIFTTSGGARMQEGLFSLMQMAKTSATLKRLHDEGILYITVLTDPTTGGVSASYAMLGDIILSEPEALIGFAGPRVIEQTIKHKLPDGFQTAEFLLEKGFVDHIVNRNEMKMVLSYLLEMHSKEV